MNKHLEELARRSSEMEEWIKKIKESTKINTRNHGASFKNLETQIEQLTKEVHAKAATKVPTSSIGQCKAVYDNAPINNASSNETNEIHRVSFIGVQDDDGLPSEGLPCQLPPKEINLGSFTLPCTIGSFDFYAMAELGASISIMPKSMFEHLKLANLKKTNMLAEMADMTKK
ncbi:reverse transcriptase domain-containing protein, partial [Tanacetum coccineum]